MFVDLFTNQQLSLLAILAATFALLISERIRIDLTAMLIILALTISGILTADEALAGFSSEPAIVVAAIFVLTGAIFHTGLSDKLGNWIGRLAGGSYQRMVLVIMPAVALLAAFTHHVTMTAVMLPITLRLSRQHKLAPSRLLMPMAFAASLGTTITIIGAPAFLLASTILRQAGQPGLGVFSIAPIGLAITLAGTLFIWLFGRLLLPERSGGDEASERFRLENYYTELVIQPNSSLIGRTIEAVEADETYAFKVVGWLRNGAVQQRPYRQKVLQAEDVLLVRISPEALASVEQRTGLALQPVAQYGDMTASTESEKKDAPERLVQAVIAPGSELIGRTIGQINFLHSYQVVVVGIWRQKGWLQTELARVRLREGDVLVLLGDEEAFARVASDRAFLLLLPFQGEPQMRNKATLAGGAMVATVVIAAFNLLSVEMAVLAGAVAVVLLGCISMRQAYQAMDVRIYVFIAGAIPLGLALQKTGLSELAAHWLATLVQGWDIRFVLLALFLTTAIITQFMSDAATTALFAPVAVTLAQTLGHSPQVYVVTVAMAAVAAFFTPIGHHGNLLIYGPGRYQFSDFLRVGTPLTFVIAGVVALIAPLLWGT
jgi:di/tricarboxylate transporter